MQSTLQNPQSKITPARLSPKQAAVLAFIRAQPLPPTVREIAWHFGVTINAVAGHLQGLERKGAIRRERLKARGIFVTDRATGGTTQAPDAQATQELVALLYELRGLSGVSYSHRLKIDRQVRRLKGGTA